MTEIIVVGAGPVGLTAALAVRATGRPVTVIETGAADRVRPGSRAIFLHGVTLNLLDRIRPGLALELARHGLQVSLLAPALDRRARDEVDCHTTRLARRVRRVKPRWLPAPDEFGAPTRPRPAGPTPLFQGEDRTA